jgi:hypothetical protein
VEPIFDIRIDDLGDQNTVNPTPFKGIQPRERKTFGHSNNLDRDPQKAPPFKHFADKKSPLGFCLRVLHV